MKFGITYEQRLIILEEYQQLAIEVFNENQDMLINKHMHLYFDVTMPMYDTSITYYGIGLNAIYTRDGIILLLDNILTTAVDIINFCQIKDNKTRFDLIFYILTFVLLHEMRHASQPQIIMSHVIPSSMQSYYINREMDADYAASMITQQKYGCPENIVNILIGHISQTPFLRPLANDVLLDLGGYYYEIIKAMYMYCNGLKSNNDTYYNIQGAIFEIPNLYLHTCINGKHECACFKYNGAFLQPTEIFCNIYKFVFVGIKDNSYDPNKDTIRITEEYIGDNDDSMIFHVIGNRLLQGFTKDIAKYYGA